MRITAQVLHQIARDYVAQQSRADRSLIAAYLQGSLLGDSFLLGGATDIDLFFIHTDDIRVPREVIRMSDEVHLDIAHLLQATYRQTRRLRIHPWLGPGVFGCKILYDPQHFLDFTQASVRGQFDQADNVLQRARTLSGEARQIWFDFHLEVRQPTAEDLLTFLKAVKKAANAIASLSGPPLTERRLSLNFQKRAEMIGRPGLYAGLLGLLGAPAIDPEVLRSWLPAWQAAFGTLSPYQALTRLHPHRREYYLRAFEALLSSPHPLDALWPLLYTWTETAGLLPVDTPEWQSWQEAATQLGFTGPHFSDRLAALDAYLDTVEEALEVWGQEYGV